jgi:photosystem II stability/assembly factor-like uncharacterized protein
VNIQKVIAHLLIPLLLMQAPTIHAAELSATTENGRTKLPTLKAAVRVEHAAQAAISAAVRAGRRLVAVGDHGVVLLSDNEGETWRQALTVPVDVMLTSVSFVDRSIGWAVGHWGVVLRTEDGGETWALQRKMLSEDRPLFAVYFFDSEHGVAVGLWSQLLVTADGGKTWGVKELPVQSDGKRPDLNLYALFSAEGADLYAAGERGMVLRSADKGITWKYLHTGYQGSFWTGAALDAKTLLVAGLRGSVYRSIDSGETWQRIESGSVGSITDTKAGSTAGKVVAVNLEGVVLQSSDSGKSFSATPNKDRSPYTAVLTKANDALVLFSRRGPVRGN